MRQRETEIQNLQREKERQREKASMRAEAMKKLSAKEKMAAQKSFELIDVDGLLGYRALDRAALLI